MTLKKRKRDKRLVCPLCRKYFYFDQLRLFNHLMKAGVEEWEGFAKAKEDCHAAWYGATINETR